MNWVRHNCVACHDYRAIRFKRADFRDATVDGDILKSRHGFLFYSLGDDHFVGPFTRQADAEKCRDTVRLHKELYGS